MLITLSHLELPQKLFNNSVALPGMLQRAGKSFSIFNPIPPTVSSGSLLLIVWDSDEISPLPGSLPWLYLQHLPTLLLFGVAYFAGPWAEGRDGACFISVSQCMSQAGTHCIFWKVNLVIHRGKQKLEMHGHFLANSVLMSFGLKNMKISGLTNTKWHYPKTSFWVKS